MENCFEQLELIAAREDCPPVFSMLGNSFFCHVASLFVAQLEFFGFICRLAMHDDAINAKCDN